MIKGKNNDKNSRSELRKFGFLMSVCFILLGGLFLWRDKGFYWCFFILSAFFLFFALVLPGALGKIYKSWMALSRIMGFFMSRLILSILFYLVLTPMGILMRLFGKDLLDINFTRNSPASYWIPKKNDNSLERDYERQF